MTRPLRVFLCHASQDKLVVHELFTALKTEGWIDPWLDKAKILPGKDWRAVIEKAVEDADVVIVCLSNQSVSKEGFVQREIKYAYDVALEKPEETIFLIPLRLDDCAVPRGLRSFHWVNYFGFEKEESYFDLLKALKERYEQILSLEEEELKRKQLDQQEKEEKARKLAAELYEREKIAREENEKEEREKNEKISREKQEREAKKKEAQHLKRKKQREFVGRILNSFSLNSRRLGIGGIIFIGLIFLLFGRNYLFTNLFDWSNASLTGTSQPQVSTSTESVTSTQFQTINPISTTFTLIPGIDSIATGEDEMILIYIPAGEFTIGSQSSSQPDEQPMYTLYLNAFWIDQTEITNRLYKKCVDADVCSPPILKKSFIQKLYYGISQFDDYPVIYVNWNMATAYCAWVGRRLPTEAEWEKAARGEDALIYPWGNEPPKKGRLNYNKIYHDTTEVGNFAGGNSIYGVFDMAGNVSEWVSSLYQPYPYYANDGRENLSSLDDRVVRGGSWDSSDDFVRVSNRERFDPTLNNVYTGFRCARSE